MIRHRPSSPGDVDLISRPASSMGLSTLHCIYQLSRGACPEPFTVPSKACLSLLTRTKGRRIHTSFPSLASYMPHHNIRPSLACPPSTEPFKQPLTTHSTPSPTSTHTKPPIIVLSSLFPFSLIRLLPWLTLPSQASPCPKTSLNPSSPY